MDLTSQGPLYLMRERGKMHELLYNITIFIIIAVIQLLSLILPLLLFLLGLFVADISRALIG